MSHSVGCFLEAKTPDQKRYYAEEIMLCEIKMNTDTFCEFIKYAKCDEMIQIMSWTPKRQLRYVVSEMFTRCNVVDKN